MQLTKFIYRLIQSIIVLIGVFTLSFILLQCLPGDAILIKFQDPEMGLSLEQIEKIRAAYQMDQSVFVQYFASLKNFLTGNWGYSIEKGTAVSTLIEANAWPTLKLSALAFLSAIIIALLIAFLSLFSPFHWLRSLFQSLPALFVSMPAFLLGIIFIQLISFKLQWIPIINPSPMQSLILPMLTLGIPISAPIAQILMRNIDVILLQPYVMVLRAKGASFWWIYTRHVFKNALPPTLTISGVVLGELIAGTVVTETIFGLNGLGALTINAVTNQDIAVLQAIVLLSSLAFISINLVVDLLYPILDPRLRNRE